MIKARIKMIAIAFAILIVALNMGGCKKCYECSGYYTCVHCWKAGDTIGTCNWPITLNNFIQQYKQAGYSCDTFSIGLNRIRTCEEPKTNVQNWEQSGLNCVETK